MEQERLYQVALTQVPGIGPLLAKNLVSYCGSATAVFSAHASKISRVPGIGEKTMQSLASSGAVKEAEAILHRADKEAVSILTYTDEKFPARLKQIADAPTVLYYRGNVSLNPGKSIAIVGTRRATSYGKTITEQIVEALLPYKPLVVSGLAYGIDIIAHRASLKAGLPTIGVMACGPDIIYPPAHRSTALEMQLAGGILSEYPFGTPPDAYNFPARNRIIAGLVDAVIVVEASAKGGALITANLALDYNREVFAVPGSILSEYSTGCNNLIRKQQAHLFLSVADLVEELRWNIKQATQTKAPTLFSDLNPTEETIVGLLKQQPAGLHIDELSWRSQLPLSSLAGVLLELELSGVVRALPGKKYTLNG